MTRQNDKPKLHIYEDRNAAGVAAAEAAAKILTECLRHQDEARVVFAAAPSQNEMLDALCAATGIDWTRVTAFHMDEYIGLSANAPQRFSRYLHEHIWDRLPFGLIHQLDGADPEAECRRYENLLAEKPIDMVCMGVGENGHIAFNDPPVADFSDPLRVKIVELDRECRQQQVNDGCFERFEDVPQRAITLTVPALMAGRALICTVPGKRKAAAVREMLEGDISTSCPASILRTHPNAVLFIDRDCWGET